jgi:hypothetical protein
MAPPGVAEVAVLAGVCWSLPNYIESMPSWYNLFFATFGIAATFRFMDTAQRGWLTLAGFWGALSILFKIAGLYFVAALYLFLTYRLLQEAKFSVPRNWRTFASGLLPMAVVAVSLVWLCLLGLTVRRNIDVMLFLQLVVPSLAVTTVAGVAAWKCYATPSTCTQTVLRSNGDAGGEVVPRLYSELAKDWGAFSLGLGVPLLVFVLYFAGHGATSELFRGVFVLPFTRLTGATYSFPEGWIPLGIAALFLLLVPTVAFNPKLDKWLAVCMVVAAGLISYLPVWDARLIIILIARMLFPSLAVACCGLLIRNTKAANSKYLDQAFLVLCVASFCSLIQFPFAAPIYFCYVAPLFVVIQQCVCFLPDRALLWSAWTSAVIGLLFAVGFVNPFSFFEDPFQVALDPPVNQLQLPRGGILVSNHDKQIYEEVVQLVQKHSAVGEFILATPDCPELYFLANRGNPTKNLLEMFDSDGASTYDRLDSETQMSIALAVINLEPKHSRRLSDETISALTERFPVQERVGHFIVFHR